MADDGCAGMEAGGHPLHGGMAVNPISFDSRLPARSPFAGLLQPPPPPPPADSANLHASFLSISVQIHVERGAGRATAESLDLEYRYEKIEVEEQTKGTPEGLKRLFEHFSPEKTATRIADFIKRGYPRTSFGATDSRREFVDFILPHVRRGVDSALAMFGELPDEVKDGAEQTFARVRDLLEGFAATA